MIPTRRDYRFSLPPEKVLDWHSDGRYVSNFLNSLSVFFPVGERFFIAAVRNYRDRVTDPELQRAVTAFIGQEAMHGREHEAYNGLLAQAGLPVQQQEERVQKLLDYALRRLPPATCLSATIALEHFTAILADRLLADERVVGNSDPAYARLWRWHALEETEHKAVAYDVWRAAVQPGIKSYALRSFGLVAGTAILFRLLARHYRENLKADPQAGNPVQGYAALARYLLSSPGLFSRNVLPWLDYFRPGFHPWDHNNAAYIEQLVDFGPNVEPAMA